MINAGHYLPYTTTTALAKNKKEKGKKNGTGKQKMF